MTHVADEPAKAKKNRRIVKPAETIREKAEKAANQESKKQGVIRLTLRYIAVPFKVIGRPLARLGRFKVVCVIVRILWPAYFRNSWKELRQVTWPKWRESVQLTGAVLLFSA